MDVAGIDFSQAEASVLASQMSGETGEKPERVAPHVRRFYRHVMGLLGNRGLAEDSQIAKSFGAFAMKEQNAPRRPEPFGRRDRQQLKKKMVEEGTLTLHKTRRTKGTPAVIDPSAVDRLLSDLPEEAKATPEAVLATIGRLFGYQTAEASQRTIRRAQRFMQNKPGRRMPSQVRSALVMATAGTVATTALFPEQASENDVAFVAALREQFGAVA